VSEEKKETALQKLERTSKQVEAEFYQDQFGNTVVEIRKRVYDIEDAIYKALLSEKYYEEYGDVFGDAAFKKHLSLGISSAVKKNPKLYPRRIHIKGKTIYYDSGRYVWEFTNGEYNVYNAEDTNCPVIFRRYTDFKEAPVEPTEKTAKELINAVTDQYRHDGIHWAYIVSFFEPLHSHPIGMVNGEPGSAKSTFTELIKELVDPSIVNRIEMPEKAADFDTYREKFYVCNYDNVRKITAEQADDLCRQVTGSSSVKRKLYTNAGMYLTSGKPRITINGVKPEPSAFNDLLDRLYPVFLRRLQQNKDENKVKKEIDKIMPELRFACLKTITKALQLEEDDYTNIPRLAEFSMLCERINLIEGGEKNEFIQHYREKMKVAHSSGLDDAFASILVEYLWQHKNSVMNHSALEWYQKIKEWAEETMPTDYGRGTPIRPEYASIVGDKDFLKNPIAIGRRFRELNQILDTLGYQVEYKRTNEKNLIEVKLK